MEWITDIITGFIQDILNSILDSVFTLVFSFFKDIAWITESSEVNALITVVVSLSITLLTLMVIKQLLTVYVLETSGDPDGDPLQLVVKVFISIALITSHPFIFNSIMSISDRVYIIVNESLRIQDLQLEDISTGLLTGIGSLGLLPLLWLVVYTVFIIILIFKALKRAIELAFLKILFPLFCVDLVTNGSEKFQTYMVSYLVVAFGYIIQIICIRLSMNMLLVNKMVEGIALLAFATKAPDWLSKYTYSSGAGAKTSGVARSAASTGVQLLRITH